MGNLRHTLACALVALVCAPLSTQAAQAQTLWLEPQSGSAGVLGGGPAGRAAGAVAFADMDGDGEEEVAAIERVVGDNYLGGFQATISRWSGDGRRVEWSEFLWGGSPSARHRLLVGNVDGSATVELVLFPTAARAGERPPPTRVVRWTGQEYEAIRCDLSGRLGALADFNGDGIAELVLVVPNRADALATDPPQLRTYAFTGDTLKRTRRLRLRTDVRALAATDVDGDGRDELLTVSLFGRLDVYGASATELLPRFSSEDRWLLKVEFLTVFEHEGTHYIYAERGALRWRTVLRLAPTGDGSFTLSAVPRFEGRPALLEAALKTTAAYSAERQTHFRLVGDDRLQGW